MLGAVVLAVGCATVSPGPQDATTTVGSALAPETFAPVPATEAVPDTASETVAPPTTEPSPLDALMINDHPHTNDGYRRADWPIWLDPDHNGCDARQDALIAASHVPVEFSSESRCQVIAGSWVSPYDDLVIANPDWVDIDHIVPLADAYRSGGWTWDPVRRANYANDQADLWAVSSSSNRSKGDRAPDEWRPPAQDAWCAYATRWVEIKIRWGLSATSAERDALGQMLETCTVPADDAS